MRKIVVICLSVFCFFACEKAPVEIAVSSITLSQGTAEMLIGETAQLTATILPQDASDKTIIWASSKKSVATVSSNGLITAIAEGQSIITASSGGKSATCQVIVSSGFVDVVSISLDKESIDLEEGGSTILVATVKPSDATDKTVVWSSSNTNVATVDQNGAVVAVKEGNATITARISDKQAICPVTVKKKVIEVTSVTLNKMELVLDKGKSETLTATVEPDNATEKSISWNSSNTDVATVNPNGKVVAIAEGSATITASIGEIHATCTVIVTIPVEAISINKTSVTLKRGESVVLSATVFPEDATEQFITWTSSNDDIATVNQDGKVTAFEDGTAIITVKSGSVQASCEITVKTIAVTSVTLNKESMTILVGEQFALDATVTPDDAADKTITWKSSNTNVATVENGVVKGIGIGTAEITATSGNHSATCSVLVVKDSSEGVSAKYYGGAMSIINGKIQSGSQLNFGVVNYSSETIHIVSVQLIDGKNGNKGNVMSVETDIASGSSSAWTITIGVSGIYDPIARFVYTFKGESYTCEAQYTSFNW